MKINLCVIFGLLIWSFQVHSTSIQNSSEDDIVSQIDQYLDVLEAGDHSPELYANLGYQYYHSNDIANAVLHYEKSLKLDPRNKLNQLALTQVKAELPIKITSIPDFILWRYYENVMNLMSSKAWSITQMVLFIALLAFLYRWLFKRPFTKEYLNWLSLSTLTLLIMLSWIFAYNKLQAEIGGSFAISMEYQNVYQAADDRSESIVSIGPGNKMYILDSIGEWYKIQLEDRDIGWVRSNGVSTI